jgi:hypothetical protein
VSRLESHGAVVLTRVEKELVTRSEDWAEAAHDGGRLSRDELTAVIKEAEATRPEVMACAHQAADLTGLDSDYQAWVVYHSHLQ